jgi:aspartate-semialdehyde dehydrogenase
MERQDLPGIRKALETFSGLPQRMDLPSAPPTPVIVTDQKDRPQPVLDINAGDMPSKGGPARATPMGVLRRAGMAVTVGRLRKEGGMVGYFVLSHNTVRGAAGGNVLSAELAKEKGLLK